MVNHQQGHGLGLVTRRPTKHQSQRGLPSERAANSTRKPRRRDVGKEQLLRAESKAGEGGGGGPEGSTEREAAGFQGRE